MQRGLSPNISLNLIQFTDPSRIGVSQIDSQHPLPVYSSLATIIHFATINFEEDDESYQYNDDGYQNSRTLFIKEFGILGLFVFPAISKKEDGLKKKTMNNSKNNKACRLWWVCC